MPSLKKNLFYNVGYQLLILIVPFITSPYVSRVLGPEGLGTYSVTTAIAKYFLIFALLGMSTYGNRTIAKSRGNKETLSIAFWNLYYFQLISSTLVMIVYLLYSISLGYTNYGIVSLCQIPYMLSAAVEVSWFFYGMEEFKGIVIRNTVVKILTTIAVFVCVNDKGDVWIYTLINALSLLGGQLCLWPFIKKYVAWKKPQFKIIVSHFKPNCILMVSVIAVSIYTLMDKIMLEWLSNIKQVGYYENTEKILTIANNAAGAIGTVMLPRLSNLRSVGNKKSIVGYVDKSMRYVMMIAFALAFGIAGSSQVFAIVYFGNEFEPCGSLLLLIAPAIICYAWSNIIRNQFLLPHDMDKVFVVATILASLVNLLLNYSLIPLYGAVGAVIGTVGAQFAELIYQSIRVRKFLSLRKYAMGILPYLGAGIIMFLICKVEEALIGVSLLTLLIQISTGAILYIILMLVYLYFVKDDLALSIICRLKSIISNKHK